MNKQTSLAIMALALAAHASANPVTLGKARAAAARLTPTTDAPALVKAAGVDASQLRKSPLADSAQKPYYIFSRGQGQGYVIVSGDDCLPAILGYTESGDFDEATCAPALADWLAGYEQLITEAQRSGRNAPRKDAARTATAGRRDIAALVQTHWHQSSPYNDQCPTITSNGNRAITGCVATAASQVVFYHKGELPDSIKYDTPTYGYGDAPVTNVFKAGTPLKWDLMQLKYSGGEPSEFREAVATFVAALGAQTWLTYGSSTSGQISNLVYTFGHQFDLSGTCVYKSGYSQSAWEGMLYDDLAAGRPVVYSGVHPTSGGHAVVLDGYQASTGLFHFNFGWGGQSDGWYTVDDQTGMNGFYGQQGMVYKIAPTRQNVEARPVHASTLATGRKNAITVNLTNHSKATYSGVMLFANNTGIEPSSTATATSNDNSTTIAPGATAAVSLTFTPRNEGLWHLFVTDNNRRVLAKDSVEAVAKSAAATLDAIAVDASAATVAGADGHAYPIVYNAKKVAGTLTTANPSDVDYSATVRLSLETSADDGATFRTVGTKAVTLKAAAGTTSQTDFSLTSSTTLPLCTDSLYRLSLQMPSKAANGDELSWATTDTTALFTLREATLEATLEADSTLKFTGDWDAATFTSLAGRRKNAAAKRYDLTEVGHVAAIPSVEGKANALIYVADGSEATGANVVTASGKSRLLDLTAGIDFEPRADIEADSVTLRIGGTPGQWRLLTTPADIALPQGIVARRIDSHSTIGITNKSTYVEQLEAGHTYLLIAASEADTLLTGAHAHVAAQPKANADTIVTGTYKATTLPAKGFILNSESNYFETASEGTAVEAMGGYLLSTGLHTTRFAAYDNLTVDTLYNSLAMLIGQCAEAMESHGP